MSTTTTNLGLTKPSATEYPDISVINNNMDLIDAAVEAGQNKVAVANGTNTSAHATSISQLTFKDSTSGSALWNGLDEVRLYNGTDALYCKEGVTTGLLMQDNQVKVVNVTWNNGVPAVGTLKGYISADGNYHLWDATANSGAGADSTSLATLRDSVSSHNFDINNKANRKLIGGITGSDEKAFLKNLSDWVVENCSTSRYMLEVYWSGHSDCNALAVKYNDTSCMILVCFTSNIYIVKKTSSTYTIALFTGTLQ